MLGSGKLAMNTRVNTSQDVVLKRCLPICQIWKKPTWLAVVLISIPKAMLASKPSQNLNCLLQHLCWHPGTSHPAPFHTLNFSNSSLLIPIYNPVILVMSPFGSLASLLTSIGTHLFCLPLSFLSHSPDPFLMAQFSLLLVFNLLLSLLALDSSRRLWLCSLSNLWLKIISSNIPWSGHVLLTSYTVLSEKAASSVFHWNKGLNQETEREATVWERQCASRRQLCLHPRKQADRKNRWKGL